YLLDEPTTGLHFSDVKKLLEVLGKLVDGGNTVLVIEHNLDVIKTADWIVDLGPEGGAQGGEVIAAGTPEQVAQIAKSYTGQRDAGAGDVSPVSCQLWGSACASDNECCTSFCYDGGCTACPLSCLATGASCRGPCGGPDSCCAGPGACSDAGICVGGCTEDGQ